MSLSLVAYESSDDEEREEQSKPMKKPKESVKITIPSLKEFEDEEDEKTAVKKPKMQSGSGLFSLLPPPKYTASATKSGFVPHILSKKEKKVASPIQNENATTTVSVALKDPKSPVSALSTSEEQESDDESSFTKGNTDTNSTCDFFWLDDLASTSETKDQHKVSVHAKNNNSLQNLSSQIHSSSSKSFQEMYFKDNNSDALLQPQQKLSTADDDQIVENMNISSEHQWQPIENNCAYNVAQNSQESLLSDKEFLKLQGRKREFENIDIIDVNADDQLTDRNEWLMKSVTEESTYRPKRKHNMPTQQQKRKHQITYLAFQAKERELDLKNQWALNRLTRRETQSKYGF